MRFVLAIISFVVAILAIGYGFAQRTILAEPDELQLETRVTTDAPVTLIDGETLNAFDGSQTVNIAGSTEVFAAYGRTADVLAWIGDASYNTLSYDAEKEKLTSTLVRGSETEVPNPSGSDLWLEDYVKEGALSFTVNVPDDISFIIVSDGVKPAPPRLSLSWPVDNSTPWSGPLIVGGAMLLLLGLALLLWALAHMRKLRGPRRKTPKMPKIPRKPTYKPINRAKPKPIEKAGTGRRAIGRGMVVAPVVVVTSLVLAGCSADAWPNFGPASTPSATPTSAHELDPDIPAPAATARQVERIVAKISAVAVEADAARNNDLIATRFDGPALELRKANYAARGADAAIAALPAIPPGPVELILPQQYDEWPRTIFAVIQDDEDETVAPVALFMIQDNARADYKVHYAVTLEPGAVLPDVAGPSIGAPRLEPDLTLFVMPPAEVAAAYADILMTDVDSPHYEAFEAEGDSLRQAVGLAKKNEAKAALSTTAKMEFSNEIGTGQTIVLATHDAGALVAVNINEITTVAPVQTGAAVNPTGAVKALSGVGVSTKGVRAVYGDQLLFYVPSATAGGKIVLLGYSQGLVAAAEL